MKKAMLFFAAFLFSVSAHAATLTLAGYDFSNAVQAVNLADSDEFGYVEGSGIAQKHPWHSAFELSSNADTPAKIEWTFNPADRFTGAFVGIRLADSASYIQRHELLGGGQNFSFIAALTAGISYIIDVFSTTDFAKSHNYTVTATPLAVSEVPVPAALFLFAPALLGLMGLRRKALKAA